MKFVSEPNLKDVCLEPEDHDDGADHDGGGREVERVGQVVRATAAADQPLRQLEPHRGVHVAFCLRVGFALVVLFS